MKLLRLKIENLKKVKDVEIQPKDHLIVIGGKNEQGKSTVLDAYQYLVEGKGAQCRQPVRIGSDRATIIGEFQAGPNEDVGNITIERTITEKGTNSLTITTEDGLKYPKPQTLLNRIHSKMLDPLAYIRMGRKEQLRFTQELVGLDFTSLDAEYQKIYDERSEANKDVNRTNAKVERMPSNENVPDEEISSNELAEELSKRVLLNQEKQQKTGKVSEMGDSLDLKTEQLENLQNRLADLEMKVKAEKVDLDLLKHNREKLSDEIRQTPDADEEEVRQQLRDLEETNKGVRQNKEKAEAIDQLKKEKATSRELTDKLKGIEKQKTDQLAQAEFPVYGMSFNDEGVLFGDLPFTEDQMSTSQMLKVATSMALSLQAQEGTTKLNQILIYRGSELDRDSQKMIEDIAKEWDAQIFIERVTRDEDDEAECQVIIEDGFVRSAEVEEKSVNAEEDFGDI